MKVAGKVSHLTERVGSLHLEPDTFEDEKILASFLRVFEHEGSITFEDTTGFRAECIFSNNPDPSA